MGYFVHYHRLEPRFLVTLLDMAIFLSSQGAQTSGWQELAVTTFSLSWSSCYFSYLPSSSPPCGSTVSSWRISPSPPCRPAGTDTPWPPFDQHWLSSLSCSHNYTPYVYQPWLSLLSCRYIHLTSINPGCHCLIVATTLTLATFQ